MKYLLYTIGLFFLMSCSEDRWDSNEKNTFVQSCREEGGTKDYCECYMSNVMHEFPIAEDANDIDFEIKIELSKNCNEE